MKFQSFDQICVLAAILVAIIFFFSGCNFDTTYEARLNSTTGSYGGTVTWTTAKDPGKGTTTVAVTVKGEGTIVIGDIPPNSKVRVVAPDGKTIVPQPKN